MLGQHEKMVKKVVICPWGDVNKTMFVRKSMDGAIPNLFLKYTVQRATLYKQKFFIAHFSTINF